LIRLWEAPHGEPAEKAKELEETMEIPEGWYPPNLPSVKIGHS
jgi:hypothetical protein